MFSHSNALTTNLISPITLSFCLGLFAKLIKSELSVPKEIYLGLSLYLLFALGLKGGVELAQADLSQILLPSLATLFLGIITPILSYLVLRKIGRFSVADSAGIAAHYGSVSAVTFIAAQNFVNEIVSSNPGMQNLEGYMPTLLALLESPGITIALAIGVLNSSSKGEKSRRNLIHEILTSRTMMLLIGGLLIGFTISHDNWLTVSEFYDPKAGIFKGLLCIFLLEMGIVTASRIKDFKKVGLFLILFGLTIPIINASIAVILGFYSGLSIGGSVVLASMAASASYIAAPPAVRMTLPEANPSYYLTLALAITFPFNIMIGIPLYMEIARKFYSFLHL